MGKFFDALKKAGNSDQRIAPESAKQKVVQISREEIDTLALDSTVTTKEPIVSAPSFSSKIDPRLLCLLDPQSAAAEMFKLLRAKIFCKDVVCQGRTIMVTSTQPMEGKSSVSANLAVSIAQGINEYVLLVDCDLRRPSLHSLFGLNARQGLGEYLEHGKSIAPYLLNTPVRKLTLLPAGKPPSNPAELLSSEKMRLLIDEMRSRYHDRYVILDATPAIYTPEITSLSPEVDGILLVVRAGKTPNELALEAVENIGREKILGVVFNACKESQKRYGYYYRSSMGGRRE